MKSNRPLYISCTILISKQACRRRGSLCLRDTEYDITYLVLRLYKCGKGVVRRVVVFLMYSSDF